MGKKILMLVVVMVGVEVTEVVVVTDNLQFYLSG